MLPWDVAMPALKSSAVDSIPSIVDVFSVTSLGKCFVCSVVFWLKHVDFYS